MVSRWPQVVAIIGIFSASAHWLGNHEITQLAKVTDGPLPIPILDYLAFTWPGWIGFGVGALWMMVLMAPEPTTTETASTRSGDGASSKRLNRPGR
jgi:hypothetical protein